MKCPTGVSRLDQLLGGGIPETSLVLVHGPRFTGRSQLVRRTLLEGLRAGRSGILVHTGVTAPRERAILELLEPDVDGLQGQLLRIDAVTRLWGGEESPGVTYVDGPRDLNGIAKAVNDAQLDLQNGQAPIIAIDSVSTLIAHGDANATFRFLQVLLGRATTSGATAIVTVDDSMHASHEVAMIKHLMDGAIQTRAGDGKMQLRLFGLGTRDSLGWVDYRTGEDDFELTGSFAAGRIR